MASTEVSIKQLPTVSSIENGNFVIVQTENSTNKLDFKDFVVGLENTTFSNTISSNTTGLNAVSGILYGTPQGSVTPLSGSNSVAVKYLPINISGTSYGILLSTLS